MRSLLKNHRSVRDMLAQRGLLNEPRAEHKPSRRLLARWGRRGLGQLTRRYQSARAVEPGNLLERKWHDIRAD